MREREVGRMNRIGWNRDIYRDKGVEIKRGDSGRENIYIERWRMRGI